MVRLIHTGELPLAERYNRIFDEFLKSVDPEILNDQIKHGKKQGFTKEEVIRSIKVAQAVEDSYQFTVKDTIDCFKKNNVYASYYNPRRLQEQEPTAASNVEYNLNLKNIPLSTKTKALIAVLKALDADPEYHKRESPAKRINAYLKKNYVELGLSKHDGSINNFGIEEIAKVANWKPDGGVPKQD